jgi:hypothetical protein
MFGILARSFKVATRSEGTWSAPDHWVAHDHRTARQRERDRYDQRRWMRQTGIM